MLCCRNRCQTVASQRDSILFSKYCLPIATSSIRCKRFNKGLVTLPVLIVENIPNIVSSQRKRNEAALKGSALSNGNCIHMNGKKPLNTS